MKTEVTNDYEKAFLLTGIIIGNFNIITGKALEQPLGELTVITKSIIDKAIETNTVIDIKYIVAELLKHSTQKV